MKLIGTKEVPDFQVEMKAPTRNASKALDRKSKTIQERAKKWDDSWSDVTEMAMKPLKDRAEMLKENPALEERVRKYPNALREHRQNAVIEQFQTLIEKSTLTPEQKELVEKPPRDKFWDNQNLKEMRDALDSFRREINCGI